MLSKGKNENIEPQWQSDGQNNIVPRNFAGSSHHRSLSGHMLSRTVSAQSISSQQFDISRSKYYKEEDAHFLRHYHNVLRPQVCWLTEQKPGPDVFETHAVNFLPVSEQESYNLALTNKEVVPCDCRSVGSESSPRI